MGCMSTESGNAILAAAVIDDVLGIICLTLVTGMADSSVNIGVVMFKILLFFVCRCCWGNFTQSILMVV